VREAGDPIGHTAADVPLLVRGKGSPTAKQRDRDDRTRHASSPDPSPGTVRQQQLSTGHGDPLSKGDQRPSVDA